MSLLGRLNGAAAAADEVIAVNCATSVTDSNSIYQCIMLTVSILNCLTHLYSAVLSHLFTERERFELMLLPC